MTDQKLPIIVYAESTPNPASMKYVANKLLIAPGDIREYTSAEAAKESLLASQLFNFPFITGVFINGNFITVTKNNSVDWLDVTMELREFIKDFLSGGKEIVSRENTVGRDTSGFMDGNKSRENINEGIKPNTELEHRIVDLLEEYVRPAVEQDGGAIHFKSFDNTSGTLTLALRGSCSGCPSSAITLKAGIQGLFQRMLPEVKEVVAEDN